jgi:hypothetical protein
MTAGVEILCRSSAANSSGAAVCILQVVEVACQIGRQLTESDRSRIDDSVRRAAMLSSKEKEQPDSGSALVKTFTLDLKRRRSFAMKGSA